jgi:hypothetical protein
LALVAMLVVACNGHPDPSPVAAGPPGIVRVAVDRSGLGEVFFSSVDHARLVARDGTILADREVSEGPPAEIAVPAGDYALLVFTVYLSDTLDCDVDPVTGGATNCVQPTLQPGQVCELAVSVPPGGSVEATFIVFAQGRCRLAPGIQHVVLTSPS